MNKRGQIYILAAVIISLVIFILALRPNFFVQEKLEDDFEKLSQNYEDESARFVNSLIITESDVSKSFFTFTSLFTSYSKSQNPNFNLIYAFGFDDHIYIGNFMNHSIIVDDNSNSYIVNGCYDRVGAVVNFQGFNFESDIEYGEVRDCLLTIDYKERIWVLIDGLWYAFEVNNRPQLIIVSREEAKDQRKVFIGGEGFSIGEEQKTIEGFCNKFKNENACLNKDPCCWKIKCTANCA